MKGSWIAYVFAFILLISAMYTRKKSTTIHKFKEEAEPQTMLHYGDDYPWASRYPMKLLD